MYSADQLLNPISALHPCGADLAFSPELDAISQARKFDDPSLDQGEWVTDLKEADWEFVATRCAALLERESKDLRLAVWLTEAGAKRHHLRGLAEGYRLLAGLCQRFWDQGLYPEADGGDHEQRIGNLSWLLARSPALLRQMPVTEGSGSAYSLVDFDVARKQATGNGDPASEAPRLAQLEAARRNNSPQFCATFAADAQYCMEALQQFEAVADARLGGDSPGFSATRDALQAMLRLMPVAGGATAADTGEDDGAAAVAQAGPPGTIHTRSQALAQLRAVASFFRRTEPHSPASYLADKAARAAEQDLHAWLQSVVKDPVSLGHIEELLGIQRPPST